MSFWPTYPRPKIEPCPECGAERKGHWFEPSNYADNEVGFWASSCRVCEEKAAAETIAARAVWIAREAELEARRLAMPTKPVVLGYVCDKNLGKRTSHQEDVCLGCDVNYRWDSSARIYVHP